MLWPFRAASYRRGREQVAHSGANCDPRRMRARPHRSTRPGVRAFTIKTDPLTNEEYLEVYLRGRQVRTDPFLNKGTAYSPEERLSLGLSGLVRSAADGRQDLRALQPHPAHNPRR